MYAPHFAAALALKSRVPRAPLWALLLGSFMPDVFWVVLARVGIEPAQASNFFDDWSHSLLSVVILATVFAAAFCRAGWEIGLAVWLAVFSHFLLDLPVHPKRLALYPLSGIHLGWDLLAWGSREGWLGIINDWWLQLFVLLLLLLFYVRNIYAMRLRASPAIASCVVLIGLQLLMLSTCISY